MKLKHQIEQFRVPDSEGELPPMEEVWPILLPTWNGRKAIYKERFIAIVELTEIEVDESGFRARATPTEVFVRPRSSDARPAIGKAWSFGASWELFSHNGNSVWGSYCGWCVWPDPNLVRRLEKLAERGDPYWQISRILDQEG